MTLYFAFIGLSLAVLIFPGPSILLIVANSLQRGRLVGLYTVAGGLVAMGAQLAVALAGLLSLADASAAGFNLVRWLGAVYLLYLGLQRWRGADQGEWRGRRVRDYRHAVVEGFVVALTNPGTMFFFVAFFPQFLADDRAVAPQLFSLAATFLLLTVVVDTGYALLAARIGQRLHEPRRAGTRNRVSGALLMLAALALAVLNV